MMCCTTTNSPHGYLPIYLPSTYLLPPTSSTYFLPTPTLFLPTLGAFGHGMTVEVQYHCDFTDLGTDTPYTQAKPLASHPALTD